MGDPKKKKKKYSGPSHPWQKSRLDEEKQLVRDYGLKNKKELWKMSSQLKKYTNQAKKLTNITTIQSEKEKKQLIERLSRLGLLPLDSKLEDVLGLTTRDILERRMQTLIYRKGFARSIKQARQFIVHEHIQIENNKITSPSYIVKQNEENLIIFNQKSSIANPEHAERTIIIKEKKEENKDKDSDKKNSDKKRIKKKQDNKNRKKEEQKTKKKEKTKNKNKK
jgi:small subunit ribosomal protein S4